MLGTITLTVGQTDGVSQKEEAPETMDTIQAEVPPQVNGEKEEKEMTEVSEICNAEEKAAEEKPDETNEVGFKKIFRFVGFKFTLKKDKSEEKDPVKLLTVKDKEGEEEIKADDNGDAKEEAATAEEEEVKSEEAVTATEASPAEADVTSAAEDAPASETGATETGATETGEGDKEAKEDGAETSPPSQGVTQSPFRKFFTVGLFSNLRKKASIKKSKDGEEEKKEADAEAGEEAAKEVEETAEAAVEEEQKAAVEEEVKEEQPAVTPEEVKPEPTPEPEAAAVDDVKEEVPDETPAPAAESTDEPAPTEEKIKEPAVEQQVAEEKPAEEKPAEEKPAEEKPAEEKPAQEKPAEEKPAEEKPVEPSTEAELLSSQEKAKPQGSPLKKLFTGAGLKKLSTKKQKSKKDGEAKLTESGEPAAEQLQSSTESAEGQKPDSTPSSPEESGEHTIGAEAVQPEAGQDAETEVTSDGEKKKDGIMPWSSFKKLVTPKKRVKRSSESEDEATGEKPVKSATLSSTESAVFVDKCSDEEANEEKPAEEEPKTETTEKLEISTEEPKKKMDTSVSWEALMCMGGTKKRTRRTSDSDDEETNAEDAAAAALSGEEQEGKGGESITTSQEADTEVQEVSSPEQATSPPEKESAWDTLKRLVMSRSKPKAEEKTEESSEQVLSDSEIPKEESSFSLRKLLPGRRKKKVEKQLSSDTGSKDEDSDTPAVVPLSEYDTEPEVQVAADVPQITVEEPAVPAVQIKVSAEDRSPSWIPAISVVEDDDKQLSDIPEEAENAATPKSADTTVADDDIEDQPLLSPEDLGSKQRQRRLSTAEVMPVIPAPAAETSPVPQGPSSETAELVLESAIVQVSEIATETSVTEEDVPLVVASAVTEYEPPVEQAESETKVVLEPHLKGEAMAICIGLGTKEIAKVALEKPVVATVEDVAVISDALAAEVAVEEKALPTEEASATEIPVLEAQIHKVDTTELEPQLDTIAAEELPDLQTASEENEPEFEKVTSVNSITQLSEMVQPSELSENSPKVAMMDPITPTVEEAIVTESIEISEANVEIKEKELEVEQLAATVEIAAIKETALAVSKEMTSALSVTETNIVTKKTEAAIPVIAAEEFACAKETVVVVGAIEKQLEQVQSEEEMVMEQVPVVEVTYAEPAQVQEITVGVPETVVNDVIEAARSEVSNVIEQVEEKMQEEAVVEAKDAIEQQGMVIAKAVIQNAVDKVSEAPEHEKPTSRTDVIPTPVNAVATIEKDIETESDKPVITDTPTPLLSEAPVEKPKSPKLLHTAVEVICSIPVETIDIPDAPVEEEKTTAVGIKQALEVTVSEDTIKEEEVVEVNTESHVEVKDQEEAESKEVKQEEEKEVSASKEVEDEPEPEPEPETVPAEEPKEKTSEPTKVILQVAHVVEELLEEEYVMEFDSNGPVDDLPPPKETTSVTDTVKKSDGPEDPEPVSDSPQTRPEETEATGSTDAAASDQEAPVPEAQVPKAKCAEVMAQVIEVIEEAVKEIEPISTEITATS